MSKLKRGSDIANLSTDVVHDAECLRLAKEFYNQFNKFHSMNVRMDKEIELAYYKDVVNSLENPFQRQYIPKDAKIFMPSSASKCKRDLYFHLTGNKKNVTNVIYPYKTRWTRNSTAVHEATQKDFLYMRKYLPYSNFQIMLTDEGVPLWEENIKTSSLITHKGKTFALVGQMDGMLEYFGDSKKPMVVGYEFKTKSNSIAQIGNYKMKDIAEEHKLQAVCYSLMFDIDTFIFDYESIVKDQWNKNEDAKPDKRVFAIKVTEEMRTAMKDKFVDVMEAIDTKKIPDMETDKCAFCEYKQLCKDYEESKGE